jgi:hypothetical protein
MMTNNSHLIERSVTARDTKHTTPLRFLSPLVPRVTPLGPLPFLPSGVFAGGEKGKGAPPSLDLLHTTSFCFSSLVCA